MLEIRKLELEKMKVLCAKEEMLFRICEYEENIKRLKENIDNQDLRVLELEEKIKILKGE